MKGTTMIQMKVEISGPLNTGRRYIELPEGVLSLQGFVGPRDSRGAEYETLFVREGYTTKEQAEAAHAEIGPRFQAELHAKLAGAAAVEWRVTPAFTAENVMHLTRERPWCATIRARFSVHPDLLFTPVAADETVAA